MNPSLNICRPAAGILIQLVRAGPHSTGQMRNYGFGVVHEAMKTLNAYTKVVEGINESDVETQLNSLILINSLFRGSAGQEKNELLDKLDSLNTRKIIMVLPFFLLSSFFFLLLFHFAAPQPLNFPFLNSFSAFDAINFKC